MFGRRKRKSVGKNDSLVYTSLDIPKCHILIGGLEHVLFVHLLGIVIPTDFHIFQREPPTSILLVTYPIKDCHEMANGSISAWWFLTCLILSSDPESHPKVGFESVSGFGFRVSSIETNFRRRFRVSGFGFRCLKPTFAVGFGFRVSGFDRSWGR